MFKAQQKLPREQLIARYHALFRLFNLVLLRLAVGGGMEPLFSSSLSLWLAFRSSSDDAFELKVGGERKLPLLLLLLLRISCLFLSCCLSLYFVVFAPSIISPPSDMIAIGLILTDFTRFSL